MDLHPDKQRGNVSSQESDHQDFLQLKKAYGYLNNSITKLLYDSYGIPGLIIYEREKDKFEELAAELRNLYSLPDIYKDSNYEWKKRQVEYEIMLKGS